MRLHADRKNILEVEFIDEEGTGLGPTLEFFALVAAEFQRADLAMWLSDDTDQSISRQDMGGGEATWLLQSWRFVFRTITSGE